MNRKLQRRYRIVRENEPIKMFDWFKLRSFYLINKSWPAPHKQYNEGWAQIEPGYMNHFLDGSPAKREDFIYMRFVDCVPLNNTGKE